MRYQPKKHVLFLSDDPPSHSGHGGLVYSHFLLSALARHGYSFSFAYIDPYARFARPFVKVGHSDVVGWKQVAGYCWSPWWQQWAHWVLRGVGRRLGFGNHRPRIGHVAAKQISRGIADLAGKQGACAVLIADTRNLESIERCYMGSVAVHAVTYDVVSDRSALFANAGWSPNFAMMDRRKEAQLLQKTDCVVAISDEDASRLREFVDGPEIVTLFPPLCEQMEPVRDAPSDQGSPITCLFVGGGSPHNIDAVETLLRVWWRLLESGSNTRLKIIGGVCSAFASVALPESVMLVGRVESLRQAYAQADISLAIVFRGTGVKLKLVEAIAYGLPAISSTEGLRGYPQDIWNEIPTADDEDELLELLNQLETEPSLLGQMRQATERLRTSTLSVDSLTRAYLNRLGDDFALRGAKNGM